MNDTSIMGLPAEQAVSFLDRSFSLPFRAKRQPMYALHGEDATDAQSFIQSHRNHFADPLELSIGFRSDDGTQWHYVTMVLDQSEHYIQLAPKDCHELFDMDLLKWRWSRIKSDYATPLSIATELELQISKALPG